MELTVGKRYRITDLQGNTFIMTAATTEVLTIVPSLLVGLAGGGLDGFRLHRSMIDSDLRIELVGDFPALRIELVEDFPASSAQPSLDQARYAALLEMLQAITAGIYYPEDRVGPEFDPNQAILHIRTRLSTFAKGPQQ